MLHRILLTLALLAPTAAVAGPDDDGFERHRGGRWAERVAHREAEILERIGRIDPEIAKKLRHLEIDDGRMYRQLMLQAHRTLEDSDDGEAALKRFVRMVTLMADIHEAVRDWEDLSPKVRKERQARIEAMAQELFELRQAERRARLAQMEQRLERVRREIEERERDKASIIEDFVDGTIDKRKLDL